MTHDFPRPLGMARMRGAVKDGKVDAYDLSIACPSVTASQFGRQNLSIPGPTSAIVAGAWDQPFRIPNYRVTGYRVPELVPVSSWRSVGASGNGFLHDCFLDELIHAAGADPLKERLRLCWHEPSRKVLEAVGEMSSWGSDPGKDRGRGIAFTLSFGVPAAEVVEVTNTLTRHQDRQSLCRRRGRQSSGPRELRQSGSRWRHLGARPRDECRTDLCGRNRPADELPCFRRHAALPGAADRGSGTRRTPTRSAASGSRLFRRPPRRSPMPIFAATGKRIRELPLNKHIDFV